MENKSEKKVWTEQERLELASKLDAELNEYIDNLERRRYTEGWPEDKWQEEMEKHPFFMKKTPEPGEELSPLVEGLQQLKYGEDENTPEELASTYKDDGNFNYKHKKYRLAILSYTKGITTKCKDSTLMAQLHNNRAATHFFLKNYRSCLNDCETALRLKPDYTKALSRAALCALYIKNYDRCIELCDRFLRKFPTDKNILSLRSKAVSAQELAKREERKKRVLEKQAEKCEETLLTTIKERGINLALISGKKTLNLQDLEPQVTQIATSRVHLDEEGKLVWPVMILYPEAQQTDFVQNFHEDCLLIDQLKELFVKSPEWDTKHEYTVENVNVYFEGRNSCSVYKVDINQSLCKILQDERYIVQAGTPTFIIFAKSCEAEKRFLSTY